MDVCFRHGGHEPFTTVEMLNARNNGAIVTRVKCSKCNHFLIKIIPANKSKVKE